MTNNNEGCVSKYARMRGGGEGGKRMPPKIALPVRPLARGCREVTKIAPTPHFLKVHGSTVLRVLEHPTLIQGNSKTSYHPGTVQNDQNKNPKTVPLVPGEWIK